MDLSDELLKPAIESRLAIVRARRLLRRLGVHTVRQLLRFVRCGGFGLCETDWLVGAGVSDDIRTLLLQSGLRVGQDRTPEGVMPERE